MSQRERIGVAVLGAGYWGAKLAREYASIEDTTDIASLISIADISASAIDSLRSQLRRNQIQYLTDYNDVLEDSGITAIHIALPNELHYEVARLVLEAGKHVLLEKPMATSSREAFKLARLAEEKGLVLQVGHIFRFNNGLRFVKELLNGGSLGKTFYANLTWSTFVPPPKNRDIVFDLAPHPIDILNFLFDEWPTGIDALGESFVRRKSGEEEMAFVNLEFPDSIFASVYLSWIHHGAKERRVSIVCENGTIDCDALNQTVDLLVEKDEAVHVFPTDVPKTSAEVVPNNTIRAMELHFLDRIRGRGPQFNSAMIGAQTVQVLESVVDAMRARRNSKTRGLSTRALIRGTKDIEA